jgi:uncharacterized protein YaeQ
MALNATIFKIKLNISDLDRHYYADHALTVAQHPSETDERLLVRVLAFALESCEHLEFGRGISATEEADLSERDLTGRVVRWIDVGLPDERRVRKACGATDHVVVYAFGGQTAERWWQKSKPDLAKQTNLTVYALSKATTDSLLKLLHPRMELQFMVQDHEMWLSSGEKRFMVERETWFSPGA